MLNIVIPMSGRGSRFLRAGYSVPKPLISIHGHPMIEYVIKNISPAQEHRFIFICQEEHLIKYDLRSLLQKLAPGCLIISVNHITAGAACTVLLSEEIINSNEPLMIANSDQYVDADINDYLAALGEYDGLIMTMPADNPKWSYVKCNDMGIVEMVREKEVISHSATVGIYNYRYGSEFVYFAHQMINMNMRVNGEFYVAPVYNEMISAGKRIVSYDVGARMYGLGVPEDLEIFKNEPLSRQCFV